MSFNVVIQKHLRIVQSSSSVFLFWFWFSYCRSYYLCQSQHFSASIKAFIFFIEGLVNLEKIVCDTRKKSKFFKYAKPIVILFVDLCKPEATDLLYHIFYMIWVLSISKSISGPCIWSHCLYSPSMNTIHFELLQLLLITIPSSVRQVLFNQPNYGVWPTYEDRGAGLPEWRVVTMRAGCVSPSLSCWVASEGPSSWQVWRERAF